MKIVFTLLLLAALSAPISIAQAHHVDDISRIDKERVVELIESDNFKIIDNRSPATYENSDKKIKGAVRLELTKLGEFMKNTPKDTTLVFYCTDHDEYLSASAALKFFKKGYKNVHALKGGWEEWFAAGYPVDEK